MVLLPVRFAPGVRAQLTPGLVQELREMFTLFQGCLLIVTVYSSILYLQASDLQHRRDFNLIQFVLKVWSCTPTSFSLD